MAFRVRWVGLEIDRQRCTAPAWRMRAKLALFWKIPKFQQLNGALKRWQLKVFAREFRAMVGQVKVDSALVKLRRGIREAFSWLVRSESVSRCVTHWSNVPPPCFYNDVLALRSGTLPVLRVMFEVTRSFDSVFLSCRVLFHVFMPFFRLLARSFWAVHRVFDRI